VTPNPSIRFLVLWSTPLDILCAPAAPLALGEALRRLQREATHGVFHTGRYRCPYYSWGAGPPLVFIPGLADSGRSFVLPISELSARFRCIAYDLPTGRGDGARLSRYTHADLVADLFALLDHLGIRQSYLLGSSLGSTVALAAMRARPDLVPRAVLQGGFAWRPLARAELLLARLGQYWPGPVRMLPFRAKAMKRVHHGPFAQRPPEVWQHYLTRTGAMPIATLACHALLLHATDLRPILGEIRQPVLMVCGDRDPLVRGAHEQILLAGLPNVRRLEVENCGHFPHYTHPELLAEIVRQFLTPPEVIPEASAGCQGR
jgi:pimeloyl-ACP methyl ester carboxylesterase